MRIAVFSTKPYDREFLDAANGAFGHAITYFEPRLTEQTVPLAAGYDAVCAFVNDVLDADNLRRLAAGGTKAVALRCAGFNNVDVAAAEAAGMVVVRVPAYSPYAVAEHAVGLMLALNRKLHRAVARVREGNFALNGLLGFDMHGRTVGIVGTGRIGTIAAEILRGFGCRLLAFDVMKNPRCQEIGVEYVPLETLYAESDIITLHCPLSPQSHHLIDARAIARMKPGAMLVNTSRGALVDTAAAIEGLKSGRVGSLAIDVYEEEADMFFEDLSSDVIQDDVFARLLTFPNVIVTGHQAFFTREALEAIAATTLANLCDVEQGRECPNRLTPQLFAKR